MRKKSFVFIPGFLILVLMLLSCQGGAALPGEKEAQSGGTVQEPQDLAGDASATPGDAPTQHPPSTAAPTSTPTLAPTPQYPCTPEECVYSGHFYLSRPFQEPANDEIDFTYRYGSTQEGARPIHHGVEFVNEEGTPVLAAAEGVVVVAGDDNQQPFADFPFYYGNLVILEHQVPGIEKPVFTLYGHLSAVHVQAGEQVQAGDRVGEVGYTGIAEWSHLHFEVRLGENLFRSTRNPELWLAPHLNPDGEFNGVLAGRIIDEYGAPIYIPAVVVERLGPQGEVLQTIYVETYADSTVNGDDALAENFAIGDLLPGTYRVSFVARGLQVREVQVYPGRVTLLVFDASQLQQDVSSAGQDPG